VNNKFTKASNMCLFRITLPEKRSERPRSSPPSQPLPLPLIRGMISRVEPDELNFLRMAWSYVQSRRINQGGIWKPPGGLRIDVHVSQGNGYVRIASALIGNLDSQQIGASYLNFACAYLLESFLSRTAWHREGRISMQWLSEDEYTSRILYHETVNDWDEEHAMSADCKLQENNQFYFVGLT